LESLMKSQDSVIGGLHHRYHTSANKVLRHIPSAWRKAEILPLGKT
jgi:hypothetical protein